MNFITADPKPKEVRYICRNMREKSRDDILPVFAGNEMDLAEMLIRSGGLFWVAYHDSRPAALIGAYQRYRGVWSLVGLGTDDWVKVWRLVTLVSARDMMEAVRNTGAHRADCTSPEHHTDTHRWLRHLGATHETTLPAFGANGEDYRLFAWLRG